MNQVFLKIMSPMALAIYFVGSLANANNLKSEGCTIAGPEDAPVVIQEFADFYCRYCVTGSNTMKEVLKNYPTKVRLVFRNLPLPFHNPGALTAAKAFSAVWLQSSSLAYSFQNELFTNHEQLLKDGDPFLYEIAQRLGVNVTQMKIDMAGAEVAKIIADDQQLADAHEFKGTPSFLIGSEEVRGSKSYEEIAKIIDKQLGRQTGI